MNYSEQSQLGKNGSVETTTLQYVPPSSTPWWTAARHWTLTRVNGWSMSCSGYPETRIIAKSSVNSCPTSGLNKPTRTNLGQLGQVASNLESNKQLVVYRRLTMYGTDKL